ncbi:unnamed protein product [Paramecium pentaurelia]|uniref:Uncharacterized protein n=1 Tax=Paramecium pentaurelia TaxID=43138 RepID=A0A8S1SNL6_9CILI|nr:unnamed protein product [Paramecium pentaurelia]
MKNILLTALLVAIVVASLRGSDRKEHNNHRDWNQERKGSNSYSSGDEYTLYDSDDKYTLYDSDDKYTLYDSDDKYTLYDSDDKYTLYDSADEEYPVYESDDKYTLYDSADEEYPVYESDDKYTLYESDDKYTLYDSADEEYPVYDSDDKYTLYDSDDEYTLYDSESSGSSSDSESESQEFKHRKNGHNQRHNKFGRRGPMRGGFHNRDQQNNNKKHPHPPRPQDEFPRKVFQNLRKTGKVILEEWNITQDPSLKNEIRAVLIANLENQLPVAQVLTPTEVVSGPAEPINTIQREHNPHPHPPTPPRPQPQDEFARQVFETLHQIGFEILEQWRIEQDVEVKNQIRANLIQQLSDLIPVQPLEVSTTILDAPLQLETVYEHSVPRLADENGN